MGRANRVLLTEGAVFTGMNMGDVVERYNNPMF